MANSELIDSIIDRGGVSKQITDTTAELEALDQQLIDTAASANALNAAIGRSTSTRQLQQSATAAAAAQERLNNIQTQGAILQERLTQAQARTAAQQDRVTQQTNRLSGEYQRLVQAFNAATLAARNAGAQFGTQSTQYIAAAANVRNLRGQLDAIDQPLGNFQRNVGNYASGIEGFAKRAFGAIRTIANILPGLGLSGAFLLIFEGLKFLVEQFGVFDKAVTTSGLTIDAYKKSLSDGSEYTKAVANISELRENIQLAKDGFLDKDKVVKQFNDTLGKTVGQVTNLNEAEDSLNKNAASFIKFTFLKATANAALEASAKKATEAQLSAVQDGFEGAGIGDKLKGILAGINPLSLTGQADAAAIFLKSEELKKKRVASQQDESDKLLKIFDDFQKKAAKVASDNKFDFFQGKEDPKKGADNRKKLLDEQIKQLELDRDKVLNDENASYDERIAAISKFESDSIDLIQAAERSKVLTRQQSSIRQDEIDAESATKRKKVQADAQKDLVNIFKSGIKEQEEILKNSLDVAEQYRSQQKSIIQGNAEDAIIGISEQYAKGLISTKEFQKQKAQIEAQAQLDSDQADIDAIQRRIQIEKALGESTSDDELKLEQAKRKLSKDTADSQIADAQRVAAERKQVSDAEKKLADQVGTFIQAAIDARYTNELNQIQDQKDALTESTNQQIDAVNRSVGSEAQKADKIAVINAKAQAQQAVLDQKAREVKNKQAQTDRLFSIARIIEQTAVAVVEALPNIPLSILVGAIGAAELATVLATPLPKYAKGGTTKGGNLIWGEAGTELAVLPGGKTLLSPDAPTVANMPAGSKIFSHEQLIKMISKPELPVYAGGTRIDIERIVMSGDRNAKMLQKAFTQREKVSGFNVNSTRRNNWEAYKKRNLN